MRASPSFEVLVITPDDVSDAVLERVLTAGAKVLGPRLAVQVRAKSSLVVLRRLATVAARLATKHGLPLFINGNVELARELGANLHVPSDMARTDVREVIENTWFSRPAHVDEEVRFAEVDGFDAVLVSPIFEVPGKGLPRGSAALTRARAIAPHLWIVALGGVTTSNAAECYEAGADAVAVMRAPFAADDPYAFFEALENARIGTERRSRRC